MKNENVRNRHAGVVDNTSHMPFNLRGVAASGDRKGAGQDNKRVQEIAKGHRIRRRGEEAVTAIVLAGGMSRRMGYDKAFLDIKGEPLIGRQLGELKNIFKNIIIATNDPQKYTSFKSVNIACDVVPGQGPLGGIYSGLLASGSFYNFVIACDMPFINKPLVRYIIENRDDYDVVIPKIGGRIHPLFGIYSKNCVSAIEEMLKHDRLEVRSIFSKVRVRFLSRREIKRFDKNMLSLLNINTPDELQRAKELDER